MIAHIIYHRKDLDGFCSGAIARKWAEEKGYQVVMIGWDYNDPRLPDELIESDNLKIIVDLSLPVDQMKQINPSNIWIDHHRSAMQDSIDHSYNGNNGYRKEGDSASLLTWRYFYPNTEPPRIVYWVDRYDVWKKNVGDEFSFDDVLKLQNTLRVYFEDPKDQAQYNHWKMFFESRKYPEFVYAKEIDLIDKIISDQRAIQAKNHFTIPSWMGYSWTALNAFGGSAVLKSIDTSKTDGIMMFTYNGERWVFSLYNDVGYDFSVIAKELGGGGHGGACGFSMNNNEFCAFIADYLIP